MPNRYTGDSKYTYGFQGQEQDNEIKGQGNSVNYKYRMHDARIGRFFATDPLEAKYPHNSSYAFSENRVIDGVELEGLEWDATKDKKGNTIDYTWKGYNEDGSAVKGTVPSASIKTGEYSSIDYGTKDKQPTISEGSSEYNFYSNKDAIKTTTEGFYSSASTMPSKETVTRDLASNIGQFGDNWEGISYRSAGIFFDISTAFSSTQVRSSAGIYGGHPGGIDRDWTLFGFGATARGTYTLGSAILNGFRTKATQHVFWSGGDVARIAAADYAKANGMKTLEMTFGGGIMNTAGKYMPRSMSGPIWDKLSYNFAKNAKGPAITFQNAAGVSLRSTWRRIEYDIVKESNNGIIFHIVK